MRSIWNYHKNLEIRGRQDQFVDFLNPLWSKTSSKTVEFKVFGSFLHLDFTWSQYDHSLFIKKVENGLFVILVYVDDILVTGSSLQLIKDTKAALHQSFKMKNLGELRYFLGIELARSKSGILMHQGKYALELISELGLGAAKPVATPLEVNAKLTPKEVDDLIKSSTSQGENDPLADVSTYQRIIGKLLYLTITRPDIAFSVQILSQFLHQPKKSHLDAAMRIVRYVKDQSGHGILLSSNSQEQVSAYCDGDWAACPNSRKSVTGFLVKLGDSLISWKSKKQSTVSRSSKLSIEA
ncbi:uncharacterized mitochondrial protein AtMg00810-like isoform X1 [Lycium barbarum]|uniref:uncharacterized mitochondrial protein AtMg00810-like isoform X1 n=1 Tax=Lycium barbarum TaxID=112863 RepID=UPI00293F57A6|nr:uncharacterized mitochondrial protein AtMg00810-like isoform X1 [Lycium barbarum]